MRGVYVGLIVLGVVAVLVLGIFFVFGVDTVDVVSGKSDVWSEFGGEEVEEDLPVDDVEVVSSGGGGGGSDGDSEGGSGGASGSVCNIPLQYSLSDFVEKIECLGEEEENCENVRAFCGIRVKNLDYDVGGVFSVRHSLFYGVEEISSEIVSENLGAMEDMDLNSEFFVNGTFDISRLRCVVNSESIPQKC